MIDYVKILEQNPNGVFATSDGEKVKTRVFQYLFTEENKVYFCTSNQKPVYNQILNNNYVSFCTYSKSFDPVLSVNGKAVFIDNTDLKQRVLDDNPGIKAIYKTGGNKIFEMFYVDVEEIETFSYKDGPNTYKV